MVNKYQAADRLHQGQVCQLFPEGTCCAINIAAAGGLLQIWEPWVKPTIIKKLGKPLRVCRARAKASMWLWLWQFLFPVASSGGKKNERNQSAVTCSHKGMFVSLTDRRSRVMPVLRPQREAGTWAGQTDRPQVDTREQCTVRHFPISFRWKTRIKPWPRS